MADIASSDVTYTLVDKGLTEGSGYRRNKVTLLFGDGALTYPSGGVPLLKASLGMPNFLHSLLLVDPASDNGLVYKYDDSAEKLRIYEVDTTGDTDKELVELDAASDTPAAATLEVLAEGW